MRASDRLDYASRKLLVELGRNLRVARQRRGRRISDWAEALSVSPNTVKRMEAGDPNVALGTYVAALAVIDRRMVAAMADVVSPARDESGMVLERSARPIRIRRATRRDDDHFLPGPA